MWRVSSGPEVIADYAMLYSSEVKDRMTSLGVVISQQEFFSQHFTRPPGPLGSMLTTTGLRDTRGMVLTFHHDKKAVRVYTQSQGIFVISSIYQPYCTSAYLLPTLRGRDRGLAAVEMSLQN